jgi:predicted acetylornithine/succinylornithine family transaminase/N-acetyl-ornithine/N-acetyl-lysine deacetylase
MSTIIETEDMYTSGVYGKRQIAILRGQGALLWDADGKEYIDCAAGHGVANIGHGRTEIAAALAAQAQRIITCPEIVYNDVRANLLERLAQVTPEGISHFFLCNSGTEAVEGAFKFARLVTGRTGIIATLRGFHGRSMGALSATWEPHYREPFAPLIPDVTHMRYNNLAAAEDAINENTAAVILELVQGEGGVHVGQEEYIQGVARLCRERGALLIIDEIQTGFGRTGTLFACEQYGVQPDILCIAKSLAGGVPMGAVGLGPRIVGVGLAPTQSLPKGVHGSTFGGNPLACAAALATLDIFEREHLAEHAAALGEHAVQRLRAMRSPLIREVRGRGLLIGIELTRRVQPYLETLCERGVLALPAGPNVLRLLPPLVITEAQLDRVLDIVAEILTVSGKQRVDAVGTGLAPVRDAVAHTDRTGRNAPSTAIQTEASPVPTIHQDISPEVTLLQQMLTIPSLSRQESALAHFLVERAQELGLHAYVDEVGNFVASTHEDFGGSAQGATPTPIVLLGHMDTVPGNIPVSLQDGVLYGRGAVDAKGPLAAFLCATARMARAGNVARPVVVVGAVEEEAATSRGARGVIDRYHPVACIIGEPSGSQAVTIGYKGRLLVDGCVESQLSHSAGPLQSSSEIATAFWERIRRHASEWNVKAGSAQGTTSVFASLQPSLRSIHNEQDGLNDRTRFSIGYRLPVNFDSAELRNQLTRWAYEDDIHISFAGEEVAYQSTRTTPLARSFIAALRATGVQPSFKLKTGTSDMNVVGPAWGDNIVAYGPGDSRLDHTPQEHIRIAEYTHAIDVLELVLTNMAQQREIGQ